MSFKSWISKLHYQPKVSPWLWPLLPISWFYGLGVALRLMAYGMDVLKSSASPVPVISIGNLTTGGTGKTPLIIEIGRGLIDSGKTIVILSRGYGATEPVAYARAFDPKHGDEAYLIQSQLPEAVVIVGRDRVSTLQRAVHDYRPDFVLLDDGFQYLPLQRSLNILLIDGSKLFGNNLLLPAGPLREPLSALRRADLIFVTKQASTETMRQIEQWVATYGSKPRPTVLPVPFQPTRLKPLRTEQLPLDALKASGRRAILVSGIAQPEAFEQDTKSLGIDVLQHFQYSDHHTYTPAHIQKLITELDRNHSEDASQHPLVITTDKDLPKITPLLPTAWQPFVYTLQTQPALDGRWFYSEFLTQMISKTPVGTAHVH